MKVTIELDCTPQEFQELFVPSDKQHEFLVTTYNAYAKALNDLIKEQIDPYNFTGLRDDKSPKKSVA